MATTLTARLAEDIGVTRIARVTGLDRTGVEVAAAIRPGGHVLQVCNGKGETWEQASSGALFEAAELAWAERVEPGALVYGSRRELIGKGDPDAVWSASALGSAGQLVDPTLWSDDIVCAWSRGHDLMSGREVLIPAQAVHCPPPGSAALGPISVAWTTNGSGAYPDLEWALNHALLEAAERDQLARVLPDGWTAEAIMSRRLRDDIVLRQAPRAAGWKAQLEARGFSVALFDLSPAPEMPGALGLPVAGALLVDLERGPVPLTAGYACRHDRDDALTSALLEAAQSRLTDIHGARDDVHHANDQEVEVLRSLLASTSGVRELARMPKNVKVRSGTHATRRLLNAFVRAGIDRVAVVRMSPENATVHAVKVVVPVFRVSELLL